MRFVPNYTIFRWGRRPANLYVYTLQKNKTKQNKTKQKICFRNNKEGNEVSSTHRMMYILCAAYTFIETQSVLIMKKQQQRRVRLQIITSKLSTVTD